MNTQSHLSQINTLPYKVYGNKSSFILLIFIHGFPNTMNMWNDYIKQYQDSYYILSISYPNFVTSDIELSNQEDRREVSESNWGISVEEIIRRFKNTIDLVNKEKRKTMLIGHDYGAFFSFCLDKEHPNYIHDMIILDVSYKIDKKLDVNTLIMLIYQLLFSFCFLIGYPIGDFFIWFVLKLCFKTKQNEAELVSSKTCYLYYFLWKKLTLQISFLLILFIFLTFFGFLSVLYGFIAMILGILLCIAVYRPPVSFKGYTDHKRLAFLYSNDSIISFHSKSWLKKIEGLSENNETLGFKGKHWFFLYKKEEVMSIITRRIKKMSN